uniref:MAT1 centre domain-containing protein n=1 Tax=Ficedula albicollis TaxID=59894 RepID=A0A803WDA3_FICAL
EMQGRCAVPTAKRGGSPVFQLLCESCVELLFVRGAGNCHECDTPLRKSNFRVQLFEDPAVDKEVEIRKKVLKIEFDFVQQLEAEFSI